MTLLCEHLCFISLVQMSREASEAGLTDPGMFIFRTVELLSLSLESWYGH